jgi:hypothetical protein
MRGELLLFWDSDVIMPTTAISDLVQTLEEEQADLVTATLKPINIQAKSESAP